MQELRSFPRGCHETSARFDGSVKKAFSSQTTLIGQGEHCSLDPEGLASIGLVPGSQIRVTTKPGAGCAVYGVGNAAGDDRHHRAHGAPGPAAARDRGGVRRHHRHAGASPVLLRRRRLKNTPSSSSGSMTTDVSAGWWWSPPMAGRSNATPTARLNASPRRWAATARARGGARDSRLEAGRSNGGTLRRQTSTRRAFRCCGRLPRVGSPMPSPSTASLRPTC